MLARELVLGRAGRWAGGLEPGGALKGLLCCGRAGVVADSAAHEGPSTASRRLRSTCASGSHPEPKPVHSLKRLLPALVRSAVLGPACSSSLRWSPVCSSEGEVSARQKSSHRSLERHKTPLAQKSWRCASRQPREWRYRAKCDRSDSPRTSRGEGEGMGGLAGLWARWPSWSAWRLKSAIECCETWCWYLRSVTKCCDMHAVCF